MPSRFIAALLGYLLATVFLWQAGRRAAYAEALEGEEVPEDLI